MSLPSAEQLFYDNSQDTAAQLKITRQLVMLHAASCNISATLDNKQVAEVIVQEFANLLSASVCSLGIWSEKDTRLYIVSSYQPEQPTVGKSNTKSIINSDPQFISKVLSRRNVLHISKDIPGSDEEILKVMFAHGVTSLLLLPLIIHNQEVGLIEVLSGTRRKYETYEIVIARLLADQAVISIENARLYQNAKQEILARQQTEEKLKYNALHDVLTNLPNRVLFMDRLEQAIFRYKRFENLEYAVLFLDMDGFKNINDSFGHMEGDRALCEIAKRLSTSIRESDTVCRFGGDEFLILLEGELNSAIVREITDRIQKNLLVPIMIEGHEFHLTTSIGISFCRPEWSDAYEYVRTSNIAMYQAKAKGGGRAELFTQTKGLEVMNKGILESAIREAARKKSFYLNFQPIYSLETLSIVGLEVLLRWARKDEIIPPTKFIPMLENFGLMPELGLWILQTAIEKYQSWNVYSRGLSQLTLSVNVSSLQLEQDDFVPQVTRILKETGMDPNKLNLEITEHVLIDDLEATREKIHALNQLGIKVHLDDFGTGYSSLSYLNELPVQALKIDRRFVQQINLAEIDRGLVSSIVSMARKFNVSVVAEGIETEKQLRGLRHLECQYGQGHFLSPALSENRLLALLRTSPFSS